MSGALRMSGAGRPAVPPVVDLTGSGWCVRSVNVDPSSRAVRFRTPGALLEVRFRPEDAAVRKIAAD